MSFETVMGALSPWMVGAEALAAVGADLQRAEGAAVPAPVTEAVGAIRAAAGLGDVAEIPAPQRAMLLGIIRLTLHQALDVLDHPDRAPGWTFDAPAILDGWGRGSAMVPALLAAAHPDLASVGRFLDVGTGVGLLAVAAATVWPDSEIVGIDPWPPSLARARANVGAAGLGDRITLREQRLADVAEVETFDCVWVPTFFLSEEDLGSGVKTAVSAVRPGGWIVLGRNREMPVALANAVATLRVVRAGGTPLAADPAIALLEGVGCTDVHVPALPPHVPIEFVLGRRPH